MNCKTCGHYKYCKHCEHFKKYEYWHMCEFCEHTKYGGHKWEKISGYKTCAVCGLVSRAKIFVNDDRLIRCANMTKQYVPKPRKL